MHSSSAASVYHIEHVGYTDGFFRSRSRLAVGRVEALGRVDGEQPACSHKSFVSSLSWLVESPCRRWPYESAELSSAMASALDERNALPARGTVLLLDSDQSIT